MPHERLLIEWLDVLRRPIHDNGYTFEDFGGNAHPMAQRSSMSRGMMLPVVQTVRGKKWKDQAIKEQEQKSHASCYDSPMSSLAVAHDGH
ncbi:MAG: hypothetical protein D6704_09705 [Nitrospirae bacterium]|nr:MAG: hypothetical protein D6704_09705 [Nitrospirota bacterium]